MRRWQTVLWIAAVIVLLDPVLSDQLSAQTTESELGSLVTNISQVESDLRDVQGQVFGGASGEIQLADDTAPTSAPPQDQSQDTVNPETGARLMQRVDGLEQQVRSLTDQVEELGNRLDQLQQQFDQFSGKAPQSSSAAPQAIVPSMPPSDGTAPPDASAASGDTASGGAPVSGNSAQGTGLAPGPTTLGQVPAGSLPQQGSVEDQYNAALAYLRQQDYANAVAALKSFIAMHGDSDLAGPATYWLGEAYFVQNDFTNAAQTFLDSIKKYPKSDKAPDSMLKLGMSLAALKQKDQACATFKALPKKYPGASQTVLDRAKVESARDSCPK